MHIFGLSPKNQNAVHFGKQEIKKGIVSEENFILLTLYENPCIDSVVSLHRFSVSMQGFINHERVFGRRTNAEK
jgi:hypothetical protein